MQNPMPVDTLHAEVAHLRQQVATLQAQLRTLSAYKTLFEQCPLPLTIYEPGGDSSATNNAARQLQQPTSGYSGTENIASAEVEHGLCFQRALHGAVVTASATRYYPTPDGQASSATTQVRWQETLYFPLCNEHDGVRLVGTIKLDVTERIQTERNLRRSEEQFRAIFESATDCILVWDQDYNYLYANQAAIDHVGTTRDKVIGKNIRDGLGHIPAFMHLWMNRIDQVITTGQPLQVEDSVPVGDRLTTSESVLSPIRTPEGDVFAVGVVYRDITARKAIEEEVHRLNAELEQRVIERTAELRQSQMLFQDVIDNFPTIIYVKDLQGRYQLVNRYAARLMQSEPAHILGKTMAELFPPELVAEWQQRDQYVRATGRPLHCEDCFSAPDGLHTYEAIVFPLVDNAGSIYATGGLSLDMTERKRAEEELRIFRTLVENAPDGIAFTNSQGVVMYANAAYNRLLGYDTAVGLTHADVTDANQPERVREVVGHLAQHGNWQGTYPYRRKDGSTFLAQLSAFKVDNGTSADAVQVAAIIRDITEQLRLEAERLALQQQVIDAQQAALRELSTPLIPLATNVLAMPLIGTIDSARAQQIMETLLDGVASHQARVALLDITGVQVIDTQVANALIRAAQAVKLLGAQVILTGIRPQIAQMLVQLGVDLSGIVTRSTLQAGIAYALRK